jgi:serine protease
VTLDAGASTDPDGQIVEYHWTDGNGQSTTGKDLRFESVPAGTYDITLRVTDDDGATDTIQKTIEVASNAGQCGDRKNVDTSRGKVQGVLDSAVLEYTTTLSNPCQVTVTLDGPTNADLDLFVTTDGRKPTNYDYDKQSATQDSQEQVIVEDVNPNQTIGILVDSWEGGGRFTATIEELGT